MNLDPFKAMTMSVAAAKRLHCCQGRGGASTTTYCHCYCFGFVEMAEQGTQAKLFYRVVTM